MPTLAKCIELHGKDLDPAEIQALKNKADEYRDEGYHGRDANMAAVEELIADLETEKTDIDTQVEEATPAPVQMQEDKGPPRGAFDPLARASRHRA